MPPEKVNKGALASSLAHHIEFCDVTLLGSFLHVHRWSSLYSSGEFECQEEAVKKEKHQEYQSHMSSIGVRLGMEICSMQGFVLWIGWRHYLGVCVLGSHLLCFFWPLKVTI